MKIIAALVGTVGLVVAAAAAAQTTAPAPQSSPGTTQPPAAQQPSPPASPSPPPSTSPTPSPSRQVQRPTEIDVGSLVGSDVRASDGKQIGEVQRVMADPKEGRITSLIISMGGTFLGGGKTLAVPWESLKFGHDGDKLVVMLEQGLLDQLPQAESDQKKDTQPAASPRGEQPKNRQ